MTMRTVTVVRQYLAAAFFIAIGLMAFGCGDTATVNQGAQLANLTVTTGTTTATLQPAFNPATTNYTVDLSNDITSVTVSAQPAVSGDTVSIDNQATMSKAIDLGQPVSAGSTTPVSIAVSGSGASPTTYTVSLVRAGLNGNNSLESLTVSSGDLDSPFNANDLSYTVDVANNVGSITVTPTLSDTAATMTVNGNPAISGQPSTVTLGGPGSNTRIDIVVTAQNNNTKTYTVLVSRGGLPGNNSLRGLTVSPGPLSPSFNANVEAYTVDVANNVGSVTVTPTLSDTAATMTVNGQATNSGQTRTITLNPAGQDTAIPIVVTAQNSSTKRYTVTVSRGVSGNFNLRSLTVSPGTLTPAFNAGTLAYTVNVASTVTSMTVRPTLADATASMTVNGQATNSGQARTITLNGVGSNTFVNILVTAQNGTQRTYSVNVSRAALGGNNNLSGLTVSPGTLNPVFNANTTSYTVDVDSNVNTLTITPTLQNSTVSMTVNGQAATSGQGQTITLNGAGSNTVINIVVTAQNGTQQTYSVNVSRAALGGNNNLSGLTVSPGTLAPAFNAGTLAYTVNVVSTVTSMTVRPTLADATASMTVNGQATNSGQARTITLNGVGSNTVINIVVTAANGNPKTYTITVERAEASSNNDLSALSVRVGTAAQTLSPRFAQSTTGYTVDTGSDVTSVTVIATLADTNATMTIEGQGTSSGQPRSINLGAAGASTAIDILVTAPNGSQKTYTVTVNKAALAGNNNLSALSVSPGSLAPSFASGTTAYTEGVASDVTSVTVTATLADTNATMAIEGQGTSSGQERSIKLGAAGTSTEIDITVTAPNGSQKTYTITVNRATPSAPPAPASAPDLIPQDDSGFLPGQDSDNITNVNTPRFRISQPGSGETPNLYVDGVKVDSTFNRGANTLKPTSALSDGDHTITSTVSNDGGESSQSPPLPVTIDTVAPGFP